MPKYRSVKTLLVTVPPSGTGVVESLALYHAPLTMIVSFGTTFFESGLVIVEKSPPFCVPIRGAACGGGCAGELSGGALWMIWPETRTDADRQIAIRKPRHLDCILHSSNWPLAFGP